MANLGMKNSKPEHVVQEGKVKAMVTNNTAKNPGLPPNKKINKNYKPNTSFDKSKAQ